MDKETVTAPAEEQTLPQPPNAPPAREETPAAPTLSELLSRNADYQSQYEAMLSEQRTQWETEASQRIDTMRVEWALSAALKQAGARNDRAVLALIDRDKIKVEGETVTGVAEQLEALQKSDPYLFQDNGGRPYFSTSTSGGTPGGRDDAIVAARYRNNPFYHG